MITAVAAPCDSDFNVAARIARERFGFNEAAICFAGSSPVTEAAFVVWVKTNLVLAKQDGNAGPGDDGGGDIARRRYRARRR